MRVLVTGGTGFIGGVLVRRLRDRGDEVVALVRDPSRAAVLRALGAELVAGDLDDNGAIRAAMTGADGVIHAAAVYRVGAPRSDHDLMRRVNVAGTERVLDAAIEAGVPRIVHVSTVNVFGNTRGEVVDESFRRDPAKGFVSWYDRTKWEAHLAAEERIGRGGPLVVVQPGAVYGPGDHSELGDQIARVMRGRLPFVSFGSLGMVVGHVEDIAGGIVLALDRGEVGRSYVLGGEITTLRHVLRAAAAAADRRPPRVSMPAWAIKAGVPMAPLVTRAMGLPPNLRELITASDKVTYWATDARARRELGYTPRDLETGLRELAGARPGR